MAQKAQIRVSNSSKQVKKIINFYGLDCNDRIQQFKYYLLRVQWVLTAFKTCVLIYNTKNLFPFLKWDVTTSHVDITFSLCPIGL